MSSPNSSRPTGSPLTDEQLDLQVEAFPLVVVAMLDSEVQGVMLGSLERIGGTPSILWGLGVARKGKHGRRRAQGDDRRAVPPRRDLVPRRGRARRDPARRSRVATRCSRATRTSCRGPATSPNGEDRAWGRRLAKRFGARAALRRPRVHGRGEGPQAAVRAGPRRQPGEGHRRRQDRVARRRARRRHAARR